MIHKWWLLEKTYIATTAWICVCQPSSADVLALLNQLKVPDAKLAYYLHCKPKAGHASPNDQYFRIKRHREER